MSDNGRYVPGLEKATPLPPDELPVEPTDTTKLKPMVAIRPKKRGIDLGGIITAIAGIALSVAGVLVEQTPTIVDFLRDLGGSPDLIGDVTQWLGYIAIAYAAVTKSKQVLPVLLLLALPAIAMAQAPPAKLLELEGIPFAGTVGSWKTTPSAPLFVSGADSARVYSGTTGTDRVIIAKVGGTYWVRAGFFGWYQVTSMRLAAYNDLQQPSPDSWALEYAFTVATIRGGELPPGAVPPRGTR